METIRSKDGTLIAFERSGEGPPLVVVPGVLTSCRRWPVLPALAERFTVYAVDRRGRGDSGDGESYALEREFEDVAAVVDTVGAEVNLLGHSFGGYCVLGAALLTSNIRRLVVYEADAPEGLGEQALPAGLIDRFQSLIDAGDRVGAVTAFFREALQMTPEEIEVAKTWPTFPAMVAAAHTLPRELRAAAAYRFETARFAQMNVPTLLLLGGDSPDFAKAFTEEWHAVLPNSRIVVLPGQQHLAHYTAPDLFIREVTAFLSEPD
ncbi:MAG: alpha/beta hydrolase [Anaerolineae bacterium]|nr:alpha/beta hydrolase [Anaerolineae bacterium]